MFKRIAMFMMLALTFVSSGLQAQDRNQEPKSRRFGFQRDQSVYIAAFHYGGDIQCRRGSQPNLGSP